MMRPRGTAPAAVHPHRQRVGLAWHCVPDAPEVYSTIGLLQMGSLHRGVLRTTCPRGVSRGSRVNFQQIHRCYVRSPAALFCSYVFFLFVCTWGESAQAQSCARPHRRRERPLDGQRLLEFVSAQSVGDAQHRQLPRARVEHDTRVVLRLYADI